MHIPVLLTIAIFVLAYGLISRRLDRTPLTAPILALAYGVVTGPYGLDILEVQMGSETMQYLAEITLAMVLFHDAARIDLRAVRRNAATPARLLGPGLLLTVALGFVIGLVLFPGLSPWEVALLAALLAPTDAALGQAVITQETVPARVRQSLNVESGLNDGLIVPLVAVLMACAAGEESSSQWTWIVHGLKAVGYGVGVGIAVGVGAARLLDKAEAAGWMHSGARRVAVAAVPITAYLVAELFHGSGFLAAFIGGLAMGSTTQHLERHLYDFTEDAGELLGVVTWIVFGVLLFPAVLTYATPGVIGYALLSLTVIRMVPVALSLIGMGYHSYTVLFIGWFGPRGLASVVFAITVAGRGDIPGAATIAGVAMWTILLSVLLHGMTASWLARAYGARVSREDDEDVHEFPAPRSRRP